MTVMDDVSLARKRRDARKTRRMIAYTAAYKLPKLTESLKYMRNIVNKFQASRVANRFG